MNIHISPINSYIVTQFLLNDPKLCALALPDNALHNLDSGWGYNPSAFEILGFFDNDNKLLGYIHYTKFTDITIEVHIAISSKEHHTGIARQCFNTFLQYIKDKTNFKVLLAITPQICLKHMHLPLIGGGYKLDGIVPNAIIWREKLQDLYLYSQEIKRD